MDVKTQSVWVSSETQRLRRVIIGTPESFVMPEPINRKQEIYHDGHPERPTRAALRPDFARFRGALERCGVEVLQPEPLGEGVPDQLTPRDIGFVVGDTLVVSSMATECRKNEWHGIRGVIDALPKENVVFAPPDVVVEGGDVVVDRGAILVGLSERTNRAGAEFIRDRFSSMYDVELVPLAQLHHDEDVLHMDCTFLPVGADHALIYLDGFREIPDRLREYTWIEIDKDEQFELGTNVLSVSPTTVISRDVSTRINDELRRIGLEVIELSFDNTPKCGGSFRCASLPLVRDAG